MAPLGLLGTYKANSNAVHESRKRRLKQHRKLGRKVAICMAAVLLAVYWLAVRLRYGMKYNDELDIDGTLYVDLGGAEHWQRKLAAPASCDDNPPVHIVVLEALGVCYLFLGLAVVCDEYFQMALETISMALKLTPDVAGATFLAAGSSAPELFTALSDTFGSHNSIGTGTIVGSAIFNILVIVGLSAVIAGKGGVWLDVDWRPICRDVSFYVYSIGLLAYVFYDDVADLVDSIVMVLSYCVYVAFMKFNSQILGQCKSRKVDDEPRDEEALERAEDVIGAIRKNNTPNEILFQSSPRRLSQTMGIRHRQSSFGSDGGFTALPRRMSQTMGIRNRPSKFRKTSWKGAMIAIIAARRFAQKRSWESWRTQIPEHECSFDADIENDVKKVETSTPTTKNKGKKVEETELEMTDSDSFYSNAVSPISTGTNVQLQNLVSDERLESVEIVEEGEEEDDEESRFTWPDSTFDRIIYVLSFPFLVAYYFTIPDCAKPTGSYQCCGKSITIKWEKLYVATFCMSICWIAGLTFYMVTWATVIGCALNISPVIMGVVFLAAGTSVPDAIGSMIAARDGEADMAIANAIGSNVFDILLGLGLPWLLSNIYYNTPVVIDKQGIIVNVIILLCTVVFFVSILVYNKWRINTVVGMCLFSLYVLYIIYCVVQAVLWSE